MADHVEDPLREQPLGELVKELASQTGTLVRQELDLAKAEMMQKGKQARAAGAMFVGAGVAALLALIALTLVLIAVLATGMQTWVAALVVTAVYALVAGGLAAGGYTRVRNAGPPVPEQTIETLKEDVRWARTRKQSGLR